MLRPLEKDPFSYRQDKTVPAFPQGQVLIVMDGACALCTKTARLIARCDHRDVIRITTSQGPLGHALLRHYGLKVDDPESWLVLENGRAFGSLEAIIQVSQHLAGAPRLLRLLAFMPRWLQDVVYGFIAQRRYRIFGSAQLCDMPDQALRRRLI